MTPSNKHASRLLILIPVALLLSACAAGDAEFTQDTPAGFWMGLWHGAISVVSLIIHLFNDSVVIYEPHNTGGWYDVGFLLGVIVIWGSAFHAKCRSAERRQRDQEWEEIGNKVEKKVMLRFKAWAENDASDEEWDEISEKVEKKLKRKLREWAEKE